MCGVAGYATFTNRLMFKYERSTLFSVTLEAGLVFTRLIHRAAALDHRTLVRVVAIGAADFAFQHWMMVRQIEFCTHFEMALEAGLGRFAWVDDRLGCTAARDVLAAWAVARFAPDVLGIFSMGHQTRMVRGLKVSGDWLVAIRAGFGAHKSCTRNRRGRHNCAGRAA